jgi:hypothetical protein
MTLYLQGEVAGLAVLSAGLVFPKRPPPRVLGPVDVPVAVVPVALGVAAPPAAFVVPENKLLPAAPVPLVPVEFAAPGPKRLPPGAAGFGKLNMGAGKQNKKKGLLFQKPE